MVGYADAVGAYGVVDGYSACVLQLRAHRLHIGLLLYEVRMPSGEIPEVQCSLGWRLARDNLCC
jgi:hypothetical protein